MRTLVLDRTTTLHLSDDQYAVIRAYANLFTHGDLKRAVVELANKKTAPPRPKNAQKQVT